MINKKLLTFSLFFTMALLVHSISNAQLSIDNVYKVNLRNSGPIISGQEVKGYYLFFQTDKINRKTNGYTLQILDENLNKIKDIQFEDSKNITLKEAAFNGADLMFVFFDEDQKHLEYRSYGIDGVQKVTYDHDLDRKTINYMKTNGGYLSPDATENKTLFSVEGKGFLADIPVRSEGEYTYDINFYGGDNRIQWTYTPEHDAKMSYASYLGSTDSVAVFEVVKKESLLGTKTFTTILGLYTNNGKKAFDFETTKDKYTFYPMNLGRLQSPTNFLIIGPYFNGGDNVLKDKSLGLGVWTMNNQGQVSFTKYNSWEKDFTNYLNISSNGKVEDIGYIYFHRILQTSDGKIYAIGEGYKKEVSALGIGMKLLGGSAAAFKLRVTDMVLLQLDANYNVKDAKIFTKNPNTVILPPGTDFLGPQYMALYVKMTGGFDYSYTETDQAHTTFVLGYSDYVRSSDYKGATFNTITCFNGKFTTDKLNLKTQASDILVLPGKTGSVALLEYFKKDKKLNIHIEKMN